MKCDRSAAMPLAGTKCGGYKPAVWSRSVAQPGSAPRSGRGGRRFKSCHSDQKKQRVSASRLRRSTCPSSEITRVSPPADSDACCTEQQPDGQPAALCLHACARGQIPENISTGTRVRLAEAKKAQDRYHDDHSFNEPNDIVHDLSPVAWGKPAPLAENAGRPVFAD